MQTLDVISVNIWQILISLINLVLLFLILKHFLYKPVKKTLEKRSKSIENDYEQARLAKEKALADQHEYELQLQSAKDQADSVIKNAVDLAAQREKEILSEAKQKAETIVSRAEEEAVLERKKAEDSIRKEIVEVSAALTEKVLERQVSEEDHKRFIDSFIDGMGDPE